MRANLMEMYIKNLRVFLKSFTKAFLEQLYNEEISNQFIDTYIEARIYNEGDENQRYFYKRVSSNLEEKAKELKPDYKHLDANFFKNMVDMYEFIYYIDGLRKVEDLKSFSKEICNSRVEKFKFSSTAKLDERIFKMIKNYLAEKEKIISDVDTEDFSLDIQKYILIDNTYKVEIKYNFKIPYIYSKKVIEEVYNEGTINEDKLLIEYNLLVANCLSDIDKCNFEKRYIVDFASTLFKKNKKLKQTLKIIENQAIQDKIVLKINYKDYIDNKEQMHLLINDGYKFAIVIDDEFEFDLVELKRLDIFEYMIVCAESKNYEEIKDNENILSSEIIYE